MQQTLRQIRGEIDRCLRKDQLLFSRRHKKLDSLLNGGREISVSLRELEKCIQVSIQSREDRINSVPKIRFPELPVVDSRSEIERAVLKHQVVIVCGETGSGKTTQLPKICLSLGRGGSGFIGHTQPRRIAARSVAARISEELGETVGKSVGYKIRFQDKTRQEALVKVMTDGILLAETQSDRYLDRYDTLIIDEAHERSLNIDFLLGYLKWLLPKRPDLKVIITSATFDPEKFSRHFGGAPIIEVSGRVYPVEVRYRGEELDPRDEKDLQQTILECVDELYREQNGDILVFLAGERDIRETAEALRKHHPERYEILPLYSRLSSAEQSRIFQAHSKSRIILSTNVAETSLTVPGIRSVIDAGTARISRYSPRSKLQRLPIERISKASAKQRSGRCGRLGPGVCIRLYSEDDFDSRLEHTDPEILRTNLASVILTMKSLKLDDIRDFPFVDPPDDRMIRDGVKLLEELSAVDEQHNLTPLGRRLARFPIDPRLARMVLAAEKEDCLSEIVVIVSALSIQDPRERPVDRSDAADRCHAQFKDGQSDFMGYLILWTHLQNQRRQLSHNKFRKHCRENFLSYLRVMEWFEIHKQLLQLIKGEMQMKPNQQPAEYGEIHRALLAGLLANIGCKTDSSEYLGARNQKFFIHPSSCQFSVKPKWLICAERVETSRVYARHVAKIDPSWIEGIGAHLLKRNYYEPHWQRKPARAAVLQQLVLFGLTISKGRKIPYEQIDPGAAREIFIRSALVNLDYHTNAPFFQSNCQLLESMSYLHHKGRRVDLMIDEDLIYQFFEERVPDSVVNGITLDHWRKQAEKKDPEVLKLTREFLQGDKNQCLDANEFPDHLTVGAIELKLEYHFEPGHEKDGVTVVVPLYRLNQLEAENFEVIVPGLLKEKIVALIKSLPKAIRKNLVPASDYAELCLDRFDRTSGPLYSSLATLLTRMSGISIVESIWKEAVLANHLMFNFRLVDENKKEMDSSRDLDLLKRNYSGHAGKNFRQLTGHGCAERTGHPKWDFGDLQDTIQIKSGEHHFIGFPALVDEGSSVGVRNFETQEEARIRHRNGLIRIFQLTLSKEFGYLKKNLRLSPSVVLAYSNLSPHLFIRFDDGNRDLVADIMRVVVGKVFVDKNNHIRSQAVYEKCLEEHKSKLIETANGCSKLITDILLDYLKIRKDLQSIPESASSEDIKEQLGLMIYESFLGRTPYDRLVEIPRYLQAVQYRVEKQKENSHRDISKLNELLPFWRKYWSSVGAQEDRCFPAPELDSFRWGLEEFRVSLFAQILKTAFPISAKRMEKAWRERCKG